MKNLSAPKLLRLALAGAHMSYCPHINDKTPGYECLCWKHEVRKWDAQVKLSSSTRIRKPRALKTHLLFYKCSNRNPTVKCSSDTKEITCQQCLKFANRPVKTPKTPKMPKITKKQKKANSLSIGSSHLMVQAP